MTEGADDGHLDDILAHLEDRADGDLERLRGLLRIPGVSTDPARSDDVARCAARSRELMEWAGLEVEVVETDGHPVVWGRRVRGDRPAVLYYGHYDVQPPDPLDEWDSPPFEPTIRDGAIHARGASDDKGQAFCHLAALASWNAVRGELPLDVHVVWEGEEEIGSPHLEPFVRAHRSDLDVRYVVVSDTSQFEDVPAITYGLRGLVYTELEVRGPSQDLHSGLFGGSVANPANALASLVGAMKGPDGRIRIPGFYDDVEPLEDWEREAWAELPFDEAAYRDHVGVNALTGEEGYTTLERRWARPTLDVNGIVGGYTGEGAKTIIPSVARAKVSMRLVPDQDPEAIREGVEAFAREHLPRGLELTVRSFYGTPAVRIPTDTPGMEAAATALERGFGKEAVFIREGGSIPIVSTFRDVLGVDALLAGFGRSDDNIHSPNERFRLADLRSGIRTAAHFPALLAGALS